MGNLCTREETLFNGISGHLELTEDRGYHARQVLFPKVYQSMDLPLSCYWISSGHNSYLTGNQISSDSGTTIITQSLLAGCRVIELDTYNQQPGFEGPVCKHGGTLTAPVSVKVCLEAIRKDAFTTSPYPVIITVEDHTDKDNQQALADVFMEVLGDMLYRPKEGQQASVYKSPEQLRGKILIRASIKADKVEAWRRLVYITNTKFESMETCNKLNTAISYSFVETVVPTMLDRAWTVSGLSRKSTKQNGVQQRSAEQLTLPHGPSHRTSAQQAFPSINEHTLLSPCAPLTPSISEPALPDHHQPVGNDTSANQPPPAVSSSPSQLPNGVQPPTALPTSPVARLPASSPHHPRHHQKSSLAQAASWAGALDFQPHEFTSHKQHHSIHDWEEWAQLLNARSKLPPSLRKKFVCEAINQHYMAANASLFKGEARSHVPAPDFFTTRRLVNSKERTLLGEKENVVATVEADTVHSLGEVYACTTRHLVRVYPSALRIMSSNYNPVKAWSLGASLVALNWQNWDKGMWLNQCWFSQNGGCGYVLKPYWMRAMAAGPPGSQSVISNPLPQRKPFRLRVQVVSAFCAQTGGWWLRKSVVVKVAVMGLPCDSRSYKTPPAPSTGGGRLHVNATYEMAIQYPEVAVLMLTLWGDDRVPAKGTRKLLGHWETPIPTLNTGNFLVHLTDVNNRYRNDRWIKLALSWDQNEDPLDILPLEELLPEPVMYATSAQSLPLQQACIALCQPVKHQQHQPVGPTAVPRNGYLGALPCKGTESPFASEASLRTLPFTERSVDRTALTTQSLEQPATPQHVADIAPAAAACSTGERSASTCPR